MVNIRLTQNFITNNPACKLDPNAFVLVLGNDKSIVPSMSRSSANIESAIRNGSPFQINLIPNCDFSIDDTIFQNLVNNSVGGGNTELLNRLLHYINIGVIEIAQDSGATLTAKQVLSYVAPSAPAEASEPAQASGQQEPVGGDRPPVGPITDTQT